MSARRALLPLALLSALACGQRPSAELPGSPGAAWTSPPLTGSARVRHAHEMRRALETLFVLRDSADSLAVRPEPRNREVFGDFVEAYLGLHVDALLRGERNRGHPDLLALDANLRVAKADLLIRMRQRRRAEEVLDEVAERFRGNERLLIDYPPGRQTSVARALELLRDRRWWRR